MNPRKKPKFLRQNWTSYKRLRKSKWRNVRGMTSKLRRKEKSHGKQPSAGYGAPRAMRFLHPSGMKDFLVHNVQELEKMDSKSAARIAGSVGKKKRVEILKKAEEKKIRILNPKK
jgi:large subunit ribosomal protein L32e